MAALVFYLASEGLQLFFHDKVSLATFLGSANFDAENNNPGALAFIVGSLAVTLFAILVGGPFGVAVG
ncbi:MAG: phosphate ABC transporter permease subunit PstC, partial [Candidatus Eremiobacteraeota bacterium]|nr:phosphate ABC transporter permease subunit PstC [Candidatus Eremiobacteraeota bacterium]